MESEVCWALHNEVQVIQSQNSWEISQQCPAHLLHHRGPGFLLKCSLPLVVQKQFQLPLVWDGTVVNESYIIL